MPATASKSAAEPGGQMISIKAPAYARDVGIIFMVTLMAIGANLSDETAAGWGIRKEYLLFGLIGVVTVSLVRYLKFTLILVIAILALGANLPAELAAEFGVDASVMLFALVAMVGTSFLNYLLKLPKGVAPIAQINSSHGARTLCAAAAKGHASMVYSLVSAGLNPNFQDEKGDTALVVAAGKGHALVVKLLLDNGADPRVADGTGMTALQAATQGGFSQTALLLKNAELLAAAQAAKAPAPAAGGGK